MIQFTAVGSSKTMAQLVDKRVVVVGDIVTMNKNRDVLVGGRLCLEGRHIVEVVRADETLPTAFANAPVVETGGTIYPGLFDLHNHLPYNMIPLWEVDRRFDNRREWQTVKEYYPAVTAPFTLLNQNRDKSYPRAIVRHAECRGLFGGVTTGHGMPLKSGAMYSGLMRNIEQPLAPELPTVKSNTPDFNPEKLAEMLEWTKQGQPYIYHLSEGVGAYGERVFRDIQQVPGGLNPHLICIHCVGIPTDGWDALRVVPGIVWSPTSNLLLYGETCKIEEAKSRGIPIAIGADWAPSGCKNLLGELKVAREVSRYKGGVLTDAELVAAVTIVPAAMVGWDKFLGSLEPGKWADLLVLAGTGGDHYARLVEAKETSVRAVVIDGRVRLGEDNGLVIADPLSSEPVSIGGKAYVLDLVEEGDDGLGGMTLAQALEKLRYGLEHLPAFEDGQKTLLLANGVTDDNELSLEDEMAQESMSSILLRGDTLPAQSMRLAPMAAVDDPDFLSAMRASVNMPDYAKKAFMA